MLGNLLAGTEESPGQVLTKGGKKVKVVRGMAGYGANLSNREKQNMKKDAIIEKYDVCVDKPNWENDLVQMQRRRFLQVLGILGFWRGNIVLP